MCVPVALTPPIKPMLAEARRDLPPEGALPGGLAFEPKPDGFRAIVFARPGLVMVQSRRGADLTASFPDIAEAAAAVAAEDLVLDGELVVPHEGRLDFIELQHRARRRGRKAIQAASEKPAHLIVFDVLQIAGAELLELPYSRRRGHLEDLFARHTLKAPFTLCPATTDRRQAQDWLDPSWGTVGIEGVVVKGQSQPVLLDQRAWVKVRSRTTAEAIIASVTGPVDNPTTLLLGRYDTDGRLRLVARTTPLPTAMRRDLAQRLVLGGPEHPWTGRRFSAGWGTQTELHHQPVRPELVAEFLADTAVDAGRFRHPVVFQRVRDDLVPDDIPLMDR
ncbi:putative ATP-dependent DNA ligase [Streptomyces zinciresistens K42]|uniref:DNA ligase (ATP) n=1 Tax=Streptomyces zinciresistens K42 TaxID=700597 RepID=G2G7B3_9ACTN|nr:putative ATP-dependent DNA ligase [Streptomyces zinciresistens K42]